MKKIVFGITDLNIGGAEKALVDILNKLADEYDITLFTIYNKGRLEQYLDERIKIISYLNFSSSELSKIKRKMVAIKFHIKPCFSKIYNKFIKGKFDTEVSFLEGPITNLFSVKSKSKKIAWVHTDLSKHYKNDYWKYAKYYEYYDKIIFVSNEAKLGFETIINNKVSKEIIHNYLDKNRIKKLASLYNVEEEIDYLVIARLVKAKAIDRLIEVVNKLNTNIKIHIIGDGEEKLNLERMITRYNLNNRIILLGAIDNVYPYIKKCKYLLIPSLYEGYPLVALEAMILGKKIISTDTGAKEALKDYNKKVIVENSFEGLSKILKNTIIKETKNLKYDATDSLEKIKKIL